MASYVKFQLQLDEKLWKHIREQDAFDSDEEALQNLLATVINSFNNNASSSSTQLMINTGKIKVQCQDDEFEKEDQPIHNGLFFRK